MSLTADDERDGISPSSNELRFSRRRLADFGQAALRLELKKADIRRRQNVSKPAETSHPSRLGRLPTSAGSPPQPPANASKSDEILLPRQSDDCIGDRSSGSPKTTASRRRFCIRSIEEDGEPTTHLRNARGRSNLKTGRMIRGWRSSSRRHSEDNALSCAMLPRARHSSMTPRCPGTSIGVKITRQH